MLNFQRPDLKKFPCLRLAYQAANQQGSSPCVLNAANEVCVQEFLRGELGFMDIPRIIEQVMRQESYIARPNLGDILRQDAWARDEALRLINND
jgi:1-deoxy-D-xylulose-5-phosphate reductoisomerase